VFAYLLTTTEVSALVISLTGSGGGTPTIVIAAVAVVVVGTAIVAVGAVRIVTPPLRWLGVREPTESERRRALKTLQRQSAICPGFIQTPMLQMALDIDEVRAGFEQAAPLGRIGQPAEVVQAVAFLMSPKASFITGAHLVVDGGVISRHA
jgi:Enoyl-(Acyl carrier protein) reductase